MLDPDHATNVAKIEPALRALRKRLGVVVECGLKKASKSSDDDLCRECDLSSLSGRIRCKYYQQAQEFWISAVVALLESVPPHGLMRGQVGTVVETLAPGVFEVEFSDDAGQGYASLARGSATTFEMRACVDGLGLAEHSGIEFERLRLLEPYAWEICMCGVQEDVPFAGDCGGGDEEGGGFAGFDPFISEMLEGFVAQSVPTGWETARVEFGDLE
jgi:hypothetical protein